MARKKQIHMKENISKYLELPSELITDTSKFTMTGNQEMTIENYKGIVEYDELVIRINTENGIIKINGTKLEIKNITAEEITLQGSIKSFEFLA